MVVTEGLKMKEDAKCIVPQRIKCKLTSPKPAKTGHLANTHRSID